MRTFSIARLENPLKSLKGVKIQTDINDLPRRVPDHHFCRSQPRKRKEPKLYALSKRALQLIGISYDKSREDPSTAEYLSGSRLMQESEPLAHNYCGYQFGNFAGQLGDGRAHLLGTINNGSKSYELQLKGSGTTPFSRFADGNSVVSSAIREYLASELMAGLHIPTTRAASLVISDEDVKRDPFYDGRVRTEKAATVLRISETFLRFGSLEVCLPRGNMRRQSALECRKILEPLCDYAISQHFPDMDIYEADPYQQLFKRLVKASAELVALWQSVGYVHGVLNTDNMSLGGVTIDYGPYAFIDYFSKDYVSNATDEHERYSYRRQPQVVENNLKRLAEAMDPLFPTSVGLQYLQQHYHAIYNTKYYQVMSSKLGLNQSQESQDIVDSLLENMHLCGTHFTNFFRIIEENSVHHKSKEDLVREIVGQSEPTEYFLNNLKAYHQFLKVDVKDVLKEDPGFNPYLITEQPERLKRKDDLRNRDCKQRTESEVQLWEGWVARYSAERAKSLELTISNPKYVVLNFIAKQVQKEIKEMSPEESVQHLEKILDVLSNPLAKNEWFEERYWKNSPVPIKLTCSS